MTNNKTECNERLSAVMEERGLSPEVAHSAILNELSNCHSCFLNLICTKRLKMTSEERNLGCQDVRNLYIQNFKQYNHPDMVLQKTLAEIQTQIDIKTLLDGRAGDVISKDRVSLLKLKKEFLELALRYGKGTVVTYIHGGKDENNNMDLTKVSEDDFT